MSEIALPRDRVPGLPPGGRLLGDERLAKLAGRGDERAFAHLYERHHQAIYRYCRSILRNDQDAQDAMQSAMMRAYAALRSHERELAVKPWLFRIAHNESISILRKRRPQEELSDLHEQPDAGVEGTLETRERLSTLMADLQALPERQRGALLMRELSGLSIEQIAGALDMSPGAAKQALFEARTSLHELSEGRAMACESVREAISQRDGRVLRSRRIRSHLRACEDCRAFRAAIGTRSADLAALAPPLPMSVASALLAHLLAHGGGHSGGGAAMAGSGAGSGTLGSGTLGSGALGQGAAGSGASLAGHAATASLLGKGVAGVAALAIAAAGTAHFATSSSRHPTSAPEQGAAAHASSTSSGRASGTSGAGSAQTHGVGAQAQKGGAKPTASQSPANGGALSHPQASMRRGGASSSQSTSSAGQLNRGHSGDRAHGAHPQGSANKNSHEHLTGGPQATRHPGLEKNGARTAPRHPRPSRAGQGQAASPRHKASTKAPSHPPAGSQGSSTARENAAQARERARARGEATTAPSTP